MEILVLGANGLLGSNVVSLALDRSLSVSGTYHSKEPSFEVDLRQLDVRNTESFDALLSEIRPEVVVNCTAMTDVDGCERQPDVAHEINGEAPAAIAKQCRERGVGFVHVSTDYVFDGTADRPYAETDDPNPVQAYGESKLAGERAVADAYEESLLVRLSFVYGIHRSTDELSGFPRWVADQIAADETTPLFTDQWITPTRAGQAAETILDLVTAGASDRYHVAARTCVTPFEFGQVLADAAGAGDGVLLEGSRDDVERDATRPQYSCLDVSRVESTLDRRQPTLREEVEAVKDYL